MLHIYHGNGKGKTTAAVGLAVCAAGSGMKVLFMQFLKNGTSSEIAILKQIDNLMVICCESSNKFTFQMDDDEKNAVVNEHGRMLEYALEQLKSGSVDMVVMDEFLDAYNKKMLSSEIADELIFSFSDTAEIVLTGRSPSEKLLEKADYVSNITAEKHPYEKGITARLGIEY